MFPRNDEQKSRTAAMRGEIKHGSKIRGLAAPRTVTRNPAQFFFFFEIANNGGGERRVEWQSGS